MKQVKSLGKYFSASFLFSFFKWFFSFEDDAGLCSGESTFTVLGYITSSALLTSVTAVA